MVINSAVRSRKAEFKTWQQMNNHRESQEGDENQDNEVPDSITTLYKYKLSPQIDTTRRSNLLILIVAYIAHMH